MKNVAKDLKLSQRAESTANRGGRVGAVYSASLVLFGPFQQNELANTASTANTEMR